jgi:outer membrane protein TolC
MATAPRSKQRSTSVPFLCLIFFAFLLLTPGLAAADKDSLDNRLQLPQTQESSGAVTSKKKSSPAAQKESIPLKKQDDSVTYSLAPSGAEAPRALRPQSSDLDAESSSKSQKAAKPAKPVESLAPVHPADAAAARNAAPIQIPKHVGKRDTVKAIMDKETSTVIEEPKTPRSFTMPEGPLNFDDCVNLALQQSPYFVQSAMEIKLKQIDETDSWYKLLPDFQLRTGYVIASSGSIDNPYILNFTTANWDPISASFGIKAAKLVTQVAILGHLKSISSGINNLGGLFMELSGLEQLATCQDELVTLAQKEKDYLTNLLNTGGSSALEIRIAEQQLEIAKLERDKIEADRRERIDKMKTVIGVDVNTNLKLDMKHTREQLLRDFDPSKATLVDVQNNSLDLIIQRHIVLMQEYNIKLAWAKFLPQFYFETRTSDPSNSSNSGLYSSAGLNWTLWDWGARNRNIGRQELTREKYKVKEDLTSIELGTSFRSALALFGRSQAAVKLAQAEVELAMLRKRQSEINYQGGSQPFPVYLQQVREFFLAKKNSLVKELENVKAAFTIRHLSGDLYNSYIDAKVYTSKKFD